ncbi:MAG: UDP-N-acetylmuramoyl-tripeptide--D-alanyl-D-alanine ligase [Anaerolineae bacterium]|nr:UDP-N-acetylmuramoyl-tripeptide--D-alanyl-D-alanine ligase [Anaerolineae bacterium]
MQLVFIMVIAFVWLAGTIFRIYRQARYYQIEEYKSNRYIRWLFSERDRWLPTRPVGVFLVGMIFAFFTDSIPGETSFLPYIIHIIIAALAVYPPDEGEIKKAFVRTQRATRLLGAAFFLAFLATMLLFALRQLAPIPTSDRFQAVFMGIGGIGLFIFAPIWLMLGNILMTPLEGFMRRRFIKKAENVLAVINPKIIGITGSYGKTTTKNFLRDMLNGRYKTYATPKSYNTLMGVCLAINNDMANDYSIEYFISEMGAYVEGEIQRITELTPPDISIVVEVGPQHLERFGTLENVAAAKYEIIKALPQQGLAIFNWDNPYVREMYDRGYPDNRIAVSRELSPDNLPENPPRFIASDITETLNGLSFAVTDTETGASEFIETPVIGIHNVTNLLLTIAVCVHEGMSLRDVAFRAKTLQPAESRLVRQVTDSGITIINDAYSANPVGVISALKVLGLHQSGKRLLITPGMIELGDMQEAENRKLGELATQYASDIILVGEKQTAPLKAGILSTDFSQEHLQVVDNLSDAIDWYKDNLKAGDTVLFLNDLPDTY